VFDLFDDDLDDMELIEGALALNSAIEPAIDSKWVEKELAELLSHAQLVLANEQEDIKRFERFIELFYKDWGFSGDTEKYFSSENVFVDKVLERKKGIPVSLGALMLYLGRKLNFPVTGVMFPTQFIIKVSWAAQTPLYINPFSGEYVPKSMLQAWLIGHDGPLAKLKPEHLADGDNPTIVGRWLAILKGALLREERYTSALRCSDLALTFVPDDPYEIRDRGFIYQQLECHHVAKHDYEYFVEQCPDDPAAEVLKLQIRAINETPLTVH
jgi:regulator of sirC expression with transglutaminase-like and TPR domain